MPCNLYEAAWIFMVYAFIGWCAEVAYAGLDKGIFVNRGFLNGSCCPIYGLGMLIVISLLTPIKDNFVLLFLGAFLLTTILEYITGWILEKVFGNKWWDYSDIPFNIKGYVCLKFSVIWGIGGVFVMDIVHPLIYRVITWIPKRAGTVLLLLIVLTFLVDLIVTVNTVLKFNKELKAFEKLEQGIRRLSDELGENIFETVSAVADKSEELQADLKADLREKQAELKALKEEYRKRLESKHFGFGRLTKAFPNMKSRKWDETLQKYKEFLENKRKG